MVHLPERVGTIVIACASAYAISDAKALKPKRFTAAHAARTAMINQLLALDDPPNTRQIATWLVGIVPSAVSKIRKQDA